MERGAMARKYVLPILAAIGLATAIVAVVEGNQALSVAPPGNPSPEPPFASYVVGTGLTEASTGDIAIGTPVSGIVGGRAIKGPADRMLVSLGHESTALGVARRYTGIADVFVLDERDADLEPAIQDLGLRTLVTDTIMSDDGARAHLAADVLAAAAAAFGRA